jgi:tRNA(Ile)-lysidine synthase
MNLSDHLRQQLSQVNAKRWVVGFSGGADSVALLHLLTSLNISCPIVALHVNHHISEASDEWQAHCERQASSFGVPIEVMHCQFPNPSSVNEQGARDARYKNFEGFLADGDVLLLAHHADDQFETTLLRLARGDGLRGVLGIPSGRAVGKGSILRPLLDVTRRDIESYCSQHALSVISDPANFDSRFLRSRVRQSLVPVFEDVIPEARQRVNESRQKLEQSYRTMLELFAVVGSGHTGLHRFGHWWRPLDELSDQRDWLHFWLSEKLSIQFRSTVFDTLLSALDFDDDQHFELKHPDGDFYWYDQRLWFCPKVTVSVPTSMPAKSFQWFGDFYTVSEQVSGLRFRPGSYRLGSVSPGATIVPAHRRGTRKLKKLYQELRVPWFARSRLPAVFDGESLVAVADLIVNHDYAVLEGEAGVVLTYKEIE